MEFKLCCDGAVGELTASQVKEIEMFITAVPYVVIASNNKEMGVRLSGLASHPGQTVGVLHFATELSSRKAKNITGDPVCELLYTDNERQVILGGKAEIVTDPEVKKAHWQPYMIGFFKEGAVDPGYCVIRFTTEQIRVMV